MASASFSPPAAGQRVLDADLAPDSSNLPFERGRLKDGRSVTLRAALAVAAHALSAFLQSAARIAAGPARLVHACRPAQ